MSKGTNATPSGHPLALLPSVCAFGFGALFRLGAVEFHLRTVFTAVVPAELGAGGAQDRTVDLGGRRQ